MAREFEVIVGARPCTRNFYGGPMTNRDVRRQGDDPCPFEDNCPVGQLPHGFCSCVMVEGAQVAVDAIATGTSIARVVNERVVPRLQKRGQAPLVYVWSPDRMTLFLLKRADEAKRIAEAIRDFALLVIEGTLDNRWVAYDVPPQAPDAAASVQLVTARRPDGKIELIAIED